jgi:LCP family protein required for cell wall assembly
VPPKPEFPGPILSGQVVIPSRRERRRAMKKRRRPGQRILRGLIGVVTVILLVVAAGYGYFRYQWSKVSSAPCSICVAAANGAPYNLLLIGSDSRVGETAAEAQQFGNATNAGGQRSDTIKIVHVDPSTGTASTLSIPRDTYVQLSGVPSSTGLSTDNKINAAFAGGPDALIQTIENTFGIPISHYIVINFFGLQDAVNALGGISMDFPYPARDRDCTTGVCYDNSGLNVPTAGCQVLNGQEALALSRSRYFEYYANGEWSYDPSSDIGRIQRQNLIISAALDKAKSTYNPLRLNGLLTGVVHDFSKDNGLSPDDLFALAERYHAFSGSQLQALTLPTTPAYTSGGSAVEVVEPDAASQMITQFLGGPFGTITSPPIDAYGNDLTLTVPTTVPTVPATAPPTTAAPSSKKTTATTAPPASNIPSFDPRPC